MHCVLQVCRALRAEADIAWQRLSLTELTLRYSVRLFAVVISRQVQPASLQMPACSVVAASQECTRHSCRCLHVPCLRSLMDNMVPSSTGTIKVIRFCSLTSAGVVQPCNDGMGPRAYYHKMLRGRCWDCRRPPNRSTLTFSEGEATGFKDCRSIPLCRECSRVSAAGCTHCVLTPVSRCGTECILLAACGAAGVQQTDCSSVCCDAAPCLLCQECSRVSAAGRADSALTPAPVNRCGTECILLAACGAAGVQQTECSSVGCDAASCLVCQECSGINTPLRCAVLVDPVSGVPQVSCYLLQATGWAAHQVALAGFTCWLTLQQIA